MRILSFEARYTVQDAYYNRAAEQTYARQLRQMATPIDETAYEQGDDESPAPPQPDYLTTLQQRVFERLCSDSELYRRVQQGTPIRWGYFKRRIQVHLQAEDNSLANADQEAYRLVKPALEHIFGAENDAWYTRREGEDNATVVILTEETRQRFLSRNGQQA
jgi:hypothetical protein